MPRTRNDKSQPNLSSDDAGIMAAVAAQMQASWEKKRKEKETKFIQNAKAELEKCISTRFEEYTAATTEINATFDKFALQYAQVEDEIRKLWMRLHQEQHKLLELSERKEKIAVEHDEAREKDQVKGMAIAKRSVEDFAKVIRSLERSG